jgi:HlyD family secretion protein
MMRLPRTLAAVLVLAGLIACGAWLFTRRTAVPVGVFQTTQVGRGDLVARISATGTLEPEEVVDVGAQVAGQILSFGRDQQGKTIDYGSVVKAGTVLAKIDDSLYALDAAQAQATLAQAQASLQRAQADLGQMQAKLVQADNDWKRAQTLGPGNALAQTSFDAYKAGYETAKANLAVGEATVVQSQAAVVQAQAALRRSQQSLAYCTIVSPVDGVIIDRRVNIGQTVVSSLNAPSLFLIAKDLKRMQVWVSVNEADIGSIHPGEPVTFTVDAHPGQTFHGEVGKTRLNATMTQNVVAYTVEVVTDNSSGVLLPYLTANVQFEVAKRTNVLYVTNSALRWSPTPQEIAPEFRRSLAAAAQSAGAAAATPPGGAEDSGPQGRPGILWVTTANGLRPLAVRTGLTDGRRTEVQGVGVVEGLKVVVGRSQAVEAPQPADANPFAPQLGRGQGGRGR